MEIIPAIDIIDGKCVRLSKGDYNAQKTYSDNPLEVARMFQDAGLKRLHLVDLDGARSSHVVNHRTLESIAGHTGLTIDFGGGIKSDEDLRIVFSSGAAMATVGSIAVSHPELMLEWISAYGPDRMILGADVRDGFISVSGWKEDSRLTLTDFLSALSSDEHLIEIFTAASVSSELFTALRFITVCVLSFTCGFLSSVAANFR